MYQNKETNDQLIEKMNSIGLNLADLVHNINAVRGRDGINADLGGTEVAFSGTTMSIAEWKEIDMNKVSANVDMAEMDYFLTTAIAARRALTEILIRAQVESDGTYARIQTAIDKYWTV